MPDKRRWWYYIDSAPGPLNAGPFASREMAASSAFALHPHLRKVYTGYGTDGPHFDIQWPENPNPILQE